MNAETQRALWYISHGQVEKLNWVQAFVFAWRDIKRELAAGSPSVYPGRYWRIVREATRSDNQRTFAPWTYAASAPVQIWLCILLSPLDVATRVKSMIQHRGHFYAGRAATRALNAKRHRFLEG